MSAKTMSKKKSSKIEEQSKQFVAIHEAGHAMIAWYYGMTLNLVSIRPGRLNDETEFAGISKSFFPDSARVDSVNHQMFTAPRVLELLAGRAATDLLCKYIMPGRGHNHDFQIVKNLFALDEDVLSMHTWRVKNPEADIEDFYQKFRPIIFKIIKSKRGNRSIKALSSALLKAGQLSGRLAVQILEKAWGKPLPPWALPAELHKSIVDEGPQTFNDLMSKIRIYVGMLKKEILPFHDSDVHSALQNQTIQKIADSLLLIQLLAMEPLPEEEKSRSKPS